MTLQAMSMLVGGVYALTHLPLVLAPALSRRGLAAFPRSEWAGRILAAIALAWAAALVRDMPLGWFDQHKDWLYVVTPAVYVLTVLFVDDLLAPRAFGGLLLLVAEPVLTAARFHPSGARLVLVLLAYGWVGVGTLLVLTPYWFRKTVERICGTDARCRILGAAGLAVGALLIGLGLTAFAA